jgi:DNA-binding NarL/FixJ family response regulator
MPRDLRVLILEDSEADAELIAAEFARAGLRIQALRVANRRGLVDALRDQPPDVVITDHALGQFGAREAVDMVQASRPTVPLIVVTGAFDDAMAVDALRAGADDFVVKTNLGRLVPAVRDALRVRARLRDLTPRQVEVFRLVAEGLSTREIADALGISIKTVETHRTALMKRLDVHDVVALVHHAVRVKLVRP